MKNNYSIAELMSLELSAFSLNLARWPVFFICADFDPRFTTSRLRAAVS